ncbi:MAG TPA: hypothetical protein VHW02_03260 [Rhizomicrobium sp.]|jgi:hypothetical protein|nr:hypothetical protein [Rhizomicrobium sp.]
MKFSSGVAALCVIWLSLFQPALSAESPHLPDWIIKSQLQWQPPPGGVVKDGRAAISIAHAIWASQFPTHFARIGTDADWQTNMMATLRDGVWEVTGKPTEGGSVGGGLFIYISQQDGRILGVYLTQ